MRIPSIPILILMTCFLLAAERQAYARRSRASEEMMKDRMLEAKSQMQEEKLSKREITYGETVNNHCIILEEQNSN